MAKVWQQTRNTLLPILLLFWLFCLPLAFSIYTPYLYQANCYWNERCAQLGQQQTERRISELNHFFQHRSDKLSSPWSEKENLHMYEVRSIYNHVFMLFGLITILLIFDGYHLTANARQQYRRHTFKSLLICIALVLCALLLIPFFTLFWAHVFHPLMFDNNLWKTNSNDVSWYLMPKAFFLRVIIFITLITLLLNLLLWRICRVTKTQQNSS